MSARMHIVCRILPVPLLRGIRGKNAHHRRACL